MTLDHYILERTVQFKTSRLSNRPRQALYAGLRQRHGQRVIRHLRWIEAILQDADRAARDAARNGNGKIAA